VTSTVLDSDVIEDEGDDLEGAEEPTRDVEKLRSRLQTAGTVLVAVGVTLVLFLGYLFWFTGIKAARAQHELLNEFTSTQAAIPLSGKLPPNGAPAAVLTIPEIGVHQVVVQGSGPSQTADGPGLMTGTARPGTIGNAVIVGRRYTGGAPFGKLDRLVRGDRFTLAAGLGKLSYVVTKTGTVTPGHLDPASPVNHPQLTIVTNGSSFASNELYYVVARQLTVPGVAGKPRHRPALVELGLTGDTSALVPALLLGVLYVGFVTGTVIAYRRRRDQSWTVYLLTTPIILALALEWFSFLYLLLPSSL
jgi:LPXTG-site transpeptidase (sortase) family protein